MPRTLTRTKDFSLVSTISLVVVVVLLSSPNYITSRRSFTQCYWSSVRNGEKNFFFHSSTYLQKLSRHHFIINNIIFGVCVRESAVILKFRQLLHTVFYYVNFCVCVWLVRHITQCLFMSLKKKLNGMLLTLIREREVQTKRPTTENTLQMPKKFSPKLHVKKIFCACFL